MKDPKDQWDPYFEGLSEYEYVGGHFDVDDVCGDDDQLQLEFSSRGSSKKPIHSES